MFFPSPRNSMDAFESLMLEGNVKTLIAGTDKLPIIANVVRRCSLERFDLPSLKELLDTSPARDIPCVGSFAEYRNKPWVYLHTSGSTALPTLVPVKHGLISSSDAFQLLENNELSKRYGNMRVLISFPPFHIAGLSYSLPAMCWLDSTAVLPPSGVVTADIVHAMHQHGSVQHSMLAPSLVKDLASNPDTLEALRNLTGITFAGGPLDPHTTRAVAEVTKLSSTLGATEYGSVPLSSKPKALEDINYFRFTDEIGGLDFRQVTGQPGLFELVMVRDPSIDIFQPIFVTFPGLQEYRTKDCFSKHPTKEGLWRYESRIDDILVLSNGEKLNPVPMEGIINRCASVKGSLVVGQGRFQTALLVEPKEENVDLQRLTVDLKPFIQQANNVTSKYGRLDLDNILFASANKPFARTGKGTIQRAKTISLYKNEIDEIYDMDEKSEPDSTEHELDLSTSALAVSSLREYIADKLGVSSHELQLDADFFTLGMDSLQVLSLAKAITAGRPKDYPPINASLVYEHPTVSKLSAAVSNGVAVREYNDFDSDDEEDIRAWEKMEETLENYRKDIIHEQPAKSATSQLPRRLREAAKSHARPPLYQPDGGLKAWMQVLGSFLINMVSASDT
jgi:acyl-CoA synthetase (AMP-forming)/AMP-acid ligase II/aryl carrier-like protein